MKNALAAIKAVLSDVSALGKQGNAALVSAIAAGVVAVAAKLIGVDLTVAEVTGWILAAAATAATIEKQIAAKPAPAPAKQVGK